MDDNVTINTFKQPKVYNDVVKLYHLYWYQHQRHPKSFRFTTGERILNQLNECMQAIIEANLVDKNNLSARHYAGDLLRKVRVMLIVIRGFLQSGWQLKIISHKSLAHFQLLLNEIEKQVSQWQRWFYREG